MKHITVKAAYSDGNAASGVRVALEVHQFIAGGMTGAEYTDRNGEAHFSLDIDSGAEISVYANGDLKAGRGSAKSVYYVTV
jgi:hypothetical protein